MTEILTESFCERCGTRYTFEPVDTRRPLASIGTLGRGLRHFFTDPGSTLGESFAVARSETEQRATAHALEAFHRTFNFCLSCRQYVCGECWNAVEGRCLSCAPVEVPVSEAEAAPVAMATATAAVADQAPPRIEVIGAAEVLDRRVPADDLPPPEPAEVTLSAEEQAALATRLERLAETPIEAVAEAEVEAETPIEAVAEAEVEAETPIEAEAEAEVEAAEALTAFEPGRSLDDEIAAYEQLQAATVSLEPAAEQVEPEPAPVTAAEPEPPTLSEPEPVAAAEPEPPTLSEPEPVAAAEPEPEPVAPQPLAPEPEPQPVAAVEPRPAPTPEPVATTWAAAPPMDEDRIAAVAWPSTVAEEPVPGAVDATKSPLEFLPPLLGARQAVRPGPAAAPRTGARECPSCGLSISVSARFCRRCGTPQSQAG